MKDEAGREIVGPYRRVRFWQESELEEYLYAHRILGGEECITVPPELMSAMLRTRAKALFAKYGTIREVFETLYLY